MEKTKTLEIKAGVAVVVEAKGYGARRVAGE